MGSSKFLVNECIENHTFKQNPVYAYIYLIVTDT